MSLSTLKFFRCLSLMKTTTIYCYLLTLRTIWAQKHENKIVFGILLLLHLLLIDEKQKIPLLPFYSSYHYDRGSFFIITHQKSWFVEAWRECLNKNVFPETDMAMWHNCWFPENISYSSPRMKIVSTTWKRTKLGKVVNQV